MPMQTLLRSRKLLVLVAFIWLPMTVFAQVCATQCLLMSLQEHGAFSIALRGEPAKSGADSTGVVSVDSRASFAALDVEDHDCDMKAVCAFSTLILITSAQKNLALSVARESVATTGILFVSYPSTVDTPPPRTSS